MNLALLLIFLMAPPTEDGEPLPLDKASDAVRAYIENAERQRPAHIAEMKRIMQPVAKNVIMSPEGWKEHRARVKLARSFSKRLSDQNTFVPAMEPAGALEVGYCGRLQHAVYLGIAPEPDGARVLQVIEDENVIVKSGGATYWLSGIGTGALADDDSIRLSGAWYVSGNKTYETVAGGSRTVLVLQKFDEELALPYLPPKQRQGLKAMLEAEKKLADKK